MSPCQLGIHPRPLTWLDRLTTQLGALSSTACSICRQENR